MFATNFGHFTQALDWRLVLRSSRKKGVYPHTKFAANLVWGYTTVAMGHKKTLIIIGGVVVLGVISVGVYTRSLWSENIGYRVPRSAPETVASSTSTGEAKVKDSGMTYGYATSSPILTPVKVGDVPSLNRPFFAPKAMTKETAILAEKENETLVEALKKNSQNAALWGELGMARLGAEDYVGAKEAYVYALTLQPKNLVFSDNLGVIYSNYLKDYAKAEQYFLLALQMDPKDEHLYLRLMELYQYGFKDMAKAKAILKQGLKEIPGDASFLSLLETL